MSYAAAPRRAAAQIPPDAADRLFELSLDLLCIVGSDGQLLRVNPAYERVVGWSTDELRSRPWIDVVHPDDRHLAQRRREERLAGEPGSGEIRVICRDGNTRLLAWHSSPPDEHGITYVIARDVTEERLAEAARREQDAIFRSISETTSEMMCIVDASGNYRYIAPQVARLMGVEPDLLIGTSPTEQIHPDDRHKVAETVAAALREPGAAVEVELRCRNNDGSWSVQEVTARNMLDHPVLAGIVCTARDLTARRELEAQLRQAQKMEAVGRLAGGVAHDFNNLLTVIQASCEFLASALAEGSAERADLEEIRKASARASALTRQLLAFSRQQRLEARVVDPNDVVSGVLKMLARLIGEDIELVAERGESGLVMADPGQLEQVLLNLAVNARDAMPRGGRLTITTRAITLPSPDIHPDEQPRAGAYVAITVRDTGTGMSPETRARIFEPFFTTKAPGQGTGLGLAMVYGIVKQSGGFIATETEIGLGSAFTILIPAVAAPSADDAVDGRCDAPCTAHGETILLVEDEDAVRDIARRVLARQGYRVLEARHGHDALARAIEHEGEIDLVLTDAVMPRMNGRELVRALRPVRPRARILYMSGYTDDELRPRGVVLRGHQLLHKPFTVEGLLGAVRGALNCG